VTPALRHALLAPPAVLCAAWGLAAAALTPVAVLTAVALTALAVTLAFGLARMRVLPPWISVALAGLALGVVARALPAPSHERDWIEPQRRLPAITLEQDRVRIDGVRDFRYDGKGAVVRATWDERTYDLAQLRTAWLGVSPFGDIPGVGHVFVSFGFDDGRYLAVSIESRREQREAYSPLRGMFRNYELIYVIGDERDVIGLRSNVWRDTVYLYPLRTTPEALRAAFLDILDRAGRLAGQPEFYDTVLNSCSSNLVRHVNRVAPGRVGWSIKAVLAAYADDLALDAGLFDFDGTLDEARARYRINERAAGDLDTGDFPARIRAQ
jgi:hypothetical protein